MGALHKYGAWLLVNYEDVEPLERRYKKQEIVEDLLTDLLKDLEAPVEGEKAGYFLDDDGKPKWRKEDGSVEPYKHQDESYSNTCASPRYCRCTD